MGTKLSTENFIFSLSSIGAAASAMLDHWWLFVVLLASIIGKQLWCVLAPPVASLVTYKIWMHIDPAKAVSKAELANDRHLNAIKPEVNSNSPPGLRGTGEASTDPTDSSGGL